MSSFRGMLAISASALLIAHLAACGGEDEGAGGGSEAKILEFIADSNALTEGESTTLRWTTRKAVSILLLENGIKLHAGNLPAEGSLEVRPERDTTYRLEVMDRKGRTAEATVTVEVEPFGEPRIDSFVASPSVVGRGEAATLSWKVAGADRLEIAVATGTTLVELPAGTGEGSYEVRPSDSTTYVLRARNAAGMASEEAEVVVARRPTIDLSFDTSQALFGEEVRLSWTVSRAEAVVVRAPDGAVLYEGEAKDGELSILAEVAGDYVATALGVGGEVSDTAHLSIQPKIAEFSVVAQGSSRPGEPALVSWWVHGAERIVIANGAEIVLETAEERGEASVNLGTGGIFTLRAYSGSLLTTETTTVEVVEVPLIRKITTGPLVTAGQGVTGVTTIGWEVEGASRLEMVVEPGGLVDLTHKSPRIDEVEVLFSGPGTVTLIARNNAGSVQKVIDSPVDPVPTIERLFAAPSRAGSGERVEIHWATLDAHQVILEQDGRELGVDPSQVDGMFPTEFLTAPANFTLRAFNTLGHEVVSDPLRVEIGAPNQLRFDTADGQRLYRIEDPVQLVWQNDGGTELEITWNGEPVCETTVWTEVREGSCIFEMPPEQQTVSLVLEVTNASGKDTRTLELEAVKGPIVVSFEPEFEAITEGDGLLFSWEVLPDSDQNIPTLELEDDRGNTYSMKDVTGEDVLKGSKRFTIEGWGVEPRVFTLRAKSPLPPEFEATAKVMVYGIPTVDDLNANPPFAEQQGDLVNFAWKTTHAETIELYHLAEGGIPAEEPFYREEFTEGARCSGVVGPASMCGNTMVEPSIAEPHVRLVAINRLGHRTETDFRIGVDPATIVSFTANGVEAPATIDLLEGEELTIAWETVRSTDQRFSEGFVDLRGRPNAVSFGNLGTSATAKEIIEFPEGFVFPYDGGEYKAVVVTSAGYLTFDLSATLSSTDQALPYQSGTTASYAAVDIAPFWDGMRTERTNGQQVTGGHGEILWEYIEGDVDQLVIQWADMEFTTTSYNGTPADAVLNFQVVLMEDGRFEFRYGRMDGTHEAARARWATIGAQSRNCPQNICPYGVQLVRQTEQVGGLEGRVYRFDGLHEYLADASTPVPIPPTHSMTFKPTFSRSYKFEAWNGHSRHELELQVNVHPHGRLHIWSVPEHPEPGQPVVLHWEGSSLTALEIEDATGTVIHTANSAELASGSILLGPLPQGDHRYTFRAVGAVPRDQITEAFDIHVYDAFSLDSFTASSHRIKLGESVDLSWAATNADSVEIEAIPGGPLAGVTNPAGGTVDHEPEETTTYVITVESRGRKKTAELTVEVRQAWFEEVAFSRTELPMGDTFEISWEFHDPTGEAVLTVEPFWKKNFMLEVTNEAPFESIVGNGGVEAPSTGSATTGYSDVTFPAGFTFPFFGKEFSSLRAFNYGYASFSTNQTSGTSADFVMPRQNSTTYPEGVLGVFWGLLSKMATGAIYTKFVPDAANPDKDHLIIEWSQFQFSTTSYNAPPYLNFQIVLFRDGTLDYRYGPMGVETTNSTAVGRAKGDQQGIGFNNGNYGERPYEEGYQLLYNYAMPGGLENRSWRFRPFNPQSVDSWTFMAEDSGPIRLCVETSGWKECREEFITVYEPGDLAITELMVDPGTGSPQWFEVRNLASGPIDLEGATIRIDGDTHTIQTGAAFVLPPGGYAVFAQAADPALNPDYVYGTGLTMGTGSGSVAIEWDGMLMGETSWNVGWLFQPGVSKELHALNHKPRTESRSAASQYCDSTVSYAPGSNGTPGSHGGDCATSFGYVVDFAANHPFIDISETGSELYFLTTTTSTVYTVPGGLGFSMPFFDDFATDLWLSNNGIIGFHTGKTSTTTVNRALGAGNTTSTTAPREAGILAAFWDTITLDPLNHAHSTIYLDRQTIGGSKVVIVQFNNYKYGSTTSVTYPGFLNFQVQIWENGDIAFVYGDLWRTKNIADAYRYYEGKSATIGIEAMGSAAMTDSIQYLYNQELLRPFQSFLFQKL